MGTCLCEACSGGWQDDAGFSCDNSASLERRCSLVQSRSGSVQQAGGGHLAPGADSGHQGDRAEVEEEHVGEVDIFQLWAYLGSPGKPRSRFLENQRGFQLTRSNGLVMMRSPKGIWRPSRPWTQWSWSNSMTQMGTRVSRAS